MSKGLTPNQEMYLKTILEIGDAGDQVRVKAIASRLGITMPSVTGALENLARKGLAAHTPYGVVSLTRAGKRAARRVKERNQVLVRFLREVLGVPERAAREDACTLEHVVSSDTLDRLARFLRFVQVCPLGARYVVGHFLEWAESAEKETQCDACIALGGEPRCLA